tara:strand:+ start:41 stop:370 length:330 start_codon:yes stop_codon:yes gene_type:complete
MDTCSICYNNKKLVLVDCNHAFCKPCLKKIIKYQSDNQMIPCPLCRDIMYKTNNKCINRELYYHNLIAKSKQDYGGGGLKLTTVILEVKHMPIKNNYPSKKKFKTYQNY